MNEFEEDFEVLFLWISAIKDETYSILDLSKGLELKLQNVARTLVLPNENKLVSDYKSANKILPTLLEFDRHGNNYKLSIRYFFKYKDVYLRILEKMFINTKRINALTVFGF